MLYSTNRGTNVLKLTENGNPVEGADGLYASAVWDKDSKSYIVKVANTSDKAQQVKINFKGAKALKAFNLTTLHSDDPHATNTLECPDRVVPQQQTVSADGNALTLTIPAQTFAVCKSK